MKTNKKSRDPNTLLAKNEFDIDLIKKIICNKIRKTVRDMSIKLFKTRLSS